MADNQHPTPDEHRRQIEAYIPERPGYKTYAEALRRVLEEVLLTPGRLETLRRGARPTFEKWYAATSPVRVAPAIVAKMLAEKGAGA